MRIIDRPLPVLVLAACVLALGSAFVAQYGLGLRPCQLCLIQRVPFALAGMLAALALLPRMPARARFALVMLAGLALAVNSGIAFYHVGVEQRWWASSCAGSSAGAVSVNDLAALMSRPAEARCDEPAWEWRGITMAALNVLYSGALGLLVLVSAKEKSS